MAAHLRCEVGVVNSPHDPSDDSRLDLYSLLRIELVRQVPVLVEKHRTAQYEYATLTLRKHATMC